MAHANFNIPRLAITYHPIDYLALDPGNARQHSKRQIKQIADSIRTFGFNVPILINAERRIIAGHGRWLACRELGYADVPTICLEHLTDAQRKAFMLADNRLAENACWDDRLLAEQLAELARMELDFSIEVTGFDMADIDLRIESLNTDDASGPQDADDAVPEIGRIAVTRPGDIWQLGPHRVHCGNALDVASYTALMAGRQAAMVFTDPPFNVTINHHVCGKGSIRHREFAMASGEMSQAEFTQFLTTVCTHLASHAVAGSMHFHCMDWRHLQELLAAGDAAYTELKNLCVWVKDNGGMGSLYRSQHELVLVFKSGSAPHTNNIQLGKHGRYRTNIWRYPGINSFARTNDEGNLLALHPTVKPVALVADAMLDCSRRGDIVLDPFLGSGTTLIAAERVGRIGYGLEIDPLYVDTILRRWQRHTGQQAIHVASGQPFADREAAADAEASAALPTAEATVEGGRHD